MKKNFVILLLVVGMVGLGVVVYRQRLAIHAMSAPSVTTESPIKVTPQMPRDSDDSLPVWPSAGMPRVQTQPPDPSPAKPEPTNPPPITTASSAAPVGPRSGPPATDEAPPMAQVAKMMKNPGMREMIRAQQKGTMDITYASLFRYLDLPESDLADFKSLLLEKQLALVDAGLAMMDASTTAEERTKKMGEVKDLTDSYNKRIEEFLGAEHYTVYKEFEETQPERTQVNLFKQTLGPDATLDEQQEHNLIRAMFDERKAFTFTSNLGDKHADPSQLTPEMTAKFLEESARLGERQLARAAAVLTPEQLKQFKASQEQFKAMQEFGIKMAAQMFAKPAAKAAAADATVGGTAPSQ